MQVVSEQNIIIHKDLNEPSAHFPSLISSGDKNVWSDFVITTLIYSHNLTCVLKPTVVSGVLFNWTISLVLASLVSSALFCFCHVCWPSHSEWVAAHTNVERILAEPLQRSHSRRGFLLGFLGLGVGVAGFLQACHSLIEEPRSAPQHILLRYKERLWCTYKWAYNRWFCHSVPS